MDLPDYSRLLQKGDRILDNVTRITASLDEFLAGGESAGKRNFNEALRSLRTTLVEVEKGEGLLHSLIYEPQGAELLARLDRTGEELEKLVREAREGKGLIPSLLFDPAGAKVLEDVQAAAAGVRALAADLQAIRFDIFH